MTVKNDDENEICIGDDGEEIKEYGCYDPDPMDLYHAETDLMDDKDYEQYTKGTASEKEKKELMARLLAWLEKEENKHDRR